MILSSASILLLGQTCVTDIRETPTFTIGQPSVARMSRQSSASPAEKAFLAVPSAESARASLKHITSRPHVAGTPGDHAMAEFVRDTIRAAGIPAEIDPH